MGLLKYIFMRNIPVLCAFTLSILVKSSTALFGLLGMAILLKTVVLTNNTNAAAVKNGSAASADQLSYQVSLKMRDKMTWRTACGGALIGEYKVLTAAHCFTDNMRNVQIRHVRIVAGNKKYTEKNTEVDQTGQWRSIINVTYPKSFKYPKHDIAIVFTAEKFNFNADVKWIPHASTHGDYVRDECQISGHISTNAQSENISEEVIMSSGGLVRPHSDCESILKSWYSWRILCTQQSKTELLDTRKDPGAPLACVGTGDPQDNGEVGVLVGIFTGKIGKHTFFLRVSTYYNWIRANGVPSSYLTADGTSIGPLAGNRTSIGHLAGNDKSNAHLSGNGTSIKHLEGNRTSIGHFSGNGKSIGHLAGNGTSIEYLAGNGPPIKHLAGNGASIKHLAGNGSPNAHSAASIYKFSLLCYFGLFLYLLYIIIVNKI